MSFFVVEVTKTGGTTGRGLAMLKVDGEVVKFEAREAADAAADDYRRRMNTPHATAHFDAEVVEVGADK